MSMGMTQEQFFGAHKFHGVSISLLGEHDKAEFPLILNAAGHWPFAGLLHK